MHNVIANYLPDPTQPMKYTSKTISFLNGDEKFV